MVSVFVNSRADAAALALFLISQDKPFEVIPLLENRYEILLCGPGKLGPEDASFKGNPLTTLNEFMSDVEEVGVPVIRRDWPDLAATYDHAKASIKLFGGRREQNRGPQEPSVKVDKQHRAGKSAGGPARPAVRRKAAHQS